MKNQHQTYHDEEWYLTVTYTRDEYGNIIRDETNYADGTRTVIEKALTLDDRHRVIRSEGISDDGRQTLSEYSYNKQGQTTKHYIYRYGIWEGKDINSFTDNTYDRNGNLIRVDVRWEPDNGNNGYALCTYQNDRLVREKLTSVRNRIPIRTIPMMKPVSFRPPLPAKLMVLRKPSTSPPSTNTATSWKLWPMPMPLNWHGTEKPTKNRTAGRPIFMS